MDPQTVWPSITVFAGIDGKGVYRSDDAGESWTEQNDGVTDLFRVQDLELVVNLLDNDMGVPPETEQSILYAGTNGAGLFRAPVTAPGVPLVWTPIANLPNLFVLSVEVDSNKPNIIHVGTNGGGTFRSMDEGATWEEVNDGVGQRVVFDLEIPVPIQGEIVINEVEPDPDDAIGGFGTDEAGEFIELHGPPNTLIPNMSLVFYQAGDNEGLSSCVPGGGFGDNSPGENGDYAYDFIDLQGREFDVNGLYVVSDSSIVPNGDEGPVSPGDAFDLRDDTIGVGLYMGSGQRFIDDSTPNSGLEFTTVDLLDFVIYSVGGAFDTCIQSASGFANQIDLDPTDLQNDPDATASRSPDGGSRRTLSQWTSLPMTPGQFNVDIEDMFVVTDLNGPFRTKERLVSQPEWFPINNGLNSDIVFSLAFDRFNASFSGEEPVDSDRLGRLTPYVGTSNEGVFRGTDLADPLVLLDWESASGGLPGGTTIRAMEITPPFGGVSSMMFAGSEEGRIYRRINPVGVWEEVFNGLEGVMIEAIEVYQRTDTQVIFAGTANDIANSSDGLGGGVFATVDSGANWFQTGPRVDAISGIYALDVEIDPLNTDNIYVGTFGGGVFLSPDGGETWGEKNTGIDLSDLDGISRFVQTLAIDPVTPTILYAGTDLDGIFKTINSGDTWFAANSGLTAAENLSIADIEIDPTDTDVLYAVTGDLFNSVDGGGTWLSMAGFPANTTAVDIEIDPLNTDVLYAATQNKGVLRSDDAGVSWESMNVGLTEDFVRSLAVDPNIPGTVYAGTDGAGIFKTTDAGMNWLPVSDGLENLFIVSIAIDASSAAAPMTPSQVIYAGTDGGGVYRTTDTAGVWAPFNAGLTDFEIQDIAIDPTNSLFRYAGTFGGGVFDFKEVERLIISPLTGLETTEEGGTDTFTVALTSIPIADVILRLRSSDTNEGTVFPDTLLFTTSNGMDAQTVTITGVEDGVLDNDQPYVIITDPLESFDTRFADVDPADVSAINRALLPEFPGISVSPLVGLTTDETGAQAMFNVVLTSDPSADVTINLASDDLGEGVASPSTLTFTPDNAKTPQTVTVTGVNDGVNDGDAIYTIVLAPAISADTDYMDVDPDDVPITNINNGVVFNTLYETATLGTIGQDSGAGVIINNTNFLGAKFTLASTFDITSLGGHFVGLGGNTEIFVAIVSLNGGTNFPTTPFNPANVLFSATFNAPATSDEVLVNANVQLPAGNYGILFGSGFFGAAGAAVMPSNDTDIGGPMYFFSTTSGGSYTNGGFNNARMFINGDAPCTAEIFADGFESGDTAAW